MNNSEIYNILTIVAYLLPKGCDDKHPYYKWYLTSFIAKNYGSDVVDDGIIVLHNIIEQNYLLEINKREDSIYFKLREAGVILSPKTYEKKMRLLAFYIGLVIENGKYTNIEIERLHNVSMVLGLEQGEVDIILNLIQAQTENPRYYALKVLGLSSDATEKDIKEAYRRLSLQYHPDRNLDKSIAEQKVAERKFKEIVAAKETLDYILYDYNQ